uniref:Uncharacterized protein n=1 Tax=Fagus sylvatica TaxID=28930 RepID=A0A2N9HLL4_FAGSY
MKQKLEENVVGLTASDIDSSVPKLTPEDVRKIVDKEKLIDIVVRRRFTPPYPIVGGFRCFTSKLFIRGLGWDTTTDGLDCSPAG